MGATPEQNHGGMALPWRQFISRSGWKGDGVFNATGGATASLTWDIPWDKTKEAIAMILGYSKANGAAIARVTPCRHPQFPWMRATGIAGMEGIRPKGVNKGTSGGAYQDYAAVRLTIKFEPLPYHCLDDIEPTIAQGNEYDRYMIKEADPSAEYLSREVGAFHYLVFPDGADSSLPGQKAQLLIKKRWTWTWLNVPEKGLYAFDFGRPVGTPNIDNVLGKVNKTAFAGAPAGTLLCEAPKFKAMPAPVAPEFLGVANDLARYFTVTFSFLEFDPPRPTPLPAGWPAEWRGRGWNLTVHRANGLWYPIGAEDGSPQYDAAEYTDLFKMNV